MIEILKCCVLNKFYKINHPKMDIFMAYIMTFFIIFILMPIVYFTLRFVLWLALDYFGCCSAHLQNRRLNERRSTFGQIYDRQGNIFTIADDVSNNPAPHRCTDFFYVEPNSEDAARIRAQLEKDDKDLPSYDEVMGLSGNRHMTALPLTTSDTSTNTVVSMGTSNTSVATTDTTLTVPPYSEIDPAPITTARVTASAGERAGTATLPTTAATTFTLTNETVNATSSSSSSIIAPSATTTTATLAPSTSHASTTAVVIANSVSNTSV